MKKIICYGDSNTFGYNPLDGSRFDKNIRWTSLLEKNLGGEYKVVNEGMCDRTGFVDNPKGSLFSAQKHFPVILKTRVDIIILSVGTNDLQFQYDISFDVVEKGLRKLVDLAKEKSEKVIIISPVILDERVLKGLFSFQFDEAGVKKSKEIGKIYQKIAEEIKCSLFDINTFTKPSDLDGLHYDEQSHKLIAEKLADFIKSF